ncbi:MAG: class I SAM-dependent methyltransferase [Sphingorhabdus sp.]
MYSRIAQYYDAVMARAHAHVESQIEAALKGFDASAGPILDIGAGTGMTVAVIARAVPSAEIIAIEPDPAMRAALMTRIWSDPDLRRRVTMFPMALRDAPLPEAISAAVLSASLVHLSPDERRQMWKMLAQRLAPGGIIIVEVQLPEPVELPASEVACEQVGRIEYRCSASAVPIGSDRLIWTLNYRATLADEVISEDQVTMQCWSVSPSELITEVATYGLTASGSGDLVLIRRE